ncbi:MAG: phosphate signaling complex protein PhoU [Endomicrobium sp.]|jgi:phosphate transport system protein|nr:phosphate signaling complex protein PhoU [Endomicrobium sp.]
MKKLDIEIRKLRKKILIMSNDVNKMLEIITQVFIKKNLSILNKIFHLEYKVNSNELVIYDKCLKLIALNQPVGIDLRFITSIIRINGELERIADETVNIARKINNLLKDKQFKHPMYFMKMFKIIANMLKDCIKSFNTNDYNLAISVVKNDVKINNLNKKIMEYVKHFIVNTNNIIIVQKSIDLIFIAKSIEKIGDHITNIGENIIFIIYGKDISHLKN